MTNVDIYGFSAAVARRHGKSSLLHGRIAASCSHEAWTANRTFLLVNAHDKPNKFQWRKDAFTVSDVDFSSKSVI